MCNSTISNPFSYRRTCLFPWTNPALGASSSASSFVGFFPFFCSFFVDACLFEPTACVPFLSFVSGASFSFRSDSLERFAGWLPCGSGSGSFACAWLRFFFFFVFVFSFASSVANALDGERFVPANEQGTGSTSSSSSITTLVRWWAATCAHASSSSLSTSNSSSSSSLSDASIHPPSTINSISSDDGTYASSSSSSSDSSDAEDG
mmetsp:Transcript_11183/g.68993  ORF Transcript_11183/g.68993 Transcript_11183/m.68993 type:complete len:206 (+) Transcript_11183:872-1489(+)